VTKSQANFLPLAAVAATILCGALHASAQTQLPAAPSAVLALEKEEQARPAGSGMHFTASATQPGPGGAIIESPKDGALSLSLDDAIAIGLERNLRLKYDRGNELAVKGDILGVVNALLPNLSLNANSSAQELNLAAMGFSPSLLKGFSSTGLLPPGTTIATIVKIDVTQAQINANQTLFNLPDFELYRGTKNETAVVELQTLTDRGEVVLAVGMTYLQVLADQSNVTNTEAQARSAKTLFDQATAKRDAGVGINLDALRGQVEYQQRQQDLIAAQSKLQKDIIQLTRILGIPAGQKLELTDSAPFADLAAMDLDTAKATAYVHRKDLLSLQQQVELENRELKAVKYQRLPTLAFNGFYGVIGLTQTGPYHGDFVAEGSLNVPVFREAGQRGEQQIIDSQLTVLRQREADLRVSIDAQIRSSMLDVDSSQQMVKVAQSNVELAQQELSDERDRFTAGVDDNLPLVDAEASVASAQSQLVQSLYQFNVAKLQLARNTGVVETRYRTYLGK
jgi:outer membrane protein TolC